jgi:Fe2+ transport system protein B
MTSHPCFVQPPRIAVWLVNLFTPTEEEESILGDLHEEFSHLASKSGDAVARSWYWRQSVKTITHLAGMGFRVAPWSTSAAVVGGFLLCRLVYGLPDKLLAAVTDRYLAYWSTHFNAYMFWATDGMFMAHLIASVFVGCIVALGAKGREMIATMTLALVLCALIGVAFVWVATHRPMDVAWGTLWSCADPLEIVIGGAIVRMRRSAAATLPSSA